MKAFPLPSEIRRTGNISANGSSFPIRVRDRARAAPGALHDSHTTGGGARECPSLVSGVLLSHGLTPQYHRRSGA